MKLNGYRCTHRNRWLLLIERLLSREEFLVYELYLDLMAFDKTKTLFGQVDITLEEVAKILGYSSASGISPYRAKLVKLGLLTPTKKSTFKVHNADRYLPGNKESLGKASAFAESEKNQPSAVIFKNLSPLLQATETQLQHSEQILQQNETELQPAEIMAAISSEQSAPKALSGSSKVSSEVEDNPPQPMTSHQWQQARSEDLGLPSWENKKLIDEAIEESTPIYDEYKYN